VPHAKVIAVETPLRRPSLPAPILKIADREGAVVFVIARGGLGPVLETAPGGTVTFLKFRRGSSFLGEIAFSKNGAGNLLDELCGCFCSLRLLATRDIACANEDE
jgi:hypothetical protein